MGTLTELPEWGVHVAVGFPEAPYRAIQPYAARLPDSPRSHLLRAWTAIAFRHRTCVEESQAFADGLTKIGQDAYNYERALYAFFSAGLAALESLAFGVHAMGWHVSPAGFPMATDKELRAVSIAATKNRLVASFSTEPLTASLAGLWGDSQYRTWSDRRNHLSHRATTGRSITVVLGGPAEPDRLAVFGDPLVPSLTIDRLTWLEGWLDRLLTDATAFAASHP